MAGPHVPLQCSAVTDEMLESSAGRSSCLCAASQRSPLCVVWWNVPWSQTVTFADGGSPRPASADMRGRYLLGTNTITQPRPDQNPHPCHACRFHNSMSTSSIPSWAVRVKSTSMQLPGSHSVCRQHSRAAAASRCARCAACAARTIHVA
jgi:hypothetical protein